jgi:hypothetical protein
MKRFKIIIVAFLIGAFFGTAGCLRNKRPNFAQNKPNMRTINLWMLNQLSNFSSKFPNKAAATFNLETTYQAKQSSEIKFALRKR